MRQLLRSWRYLLVAGFVLAAVLANLPWPQSAKDDAQARRSEVVSAFFNLTAEPGAGGLAGMRLDWLVRTEQLRDRRRERLVHVHPDLLAAHARQLEMTPTAFREMLIDPNRPDAFDIAGATLAFPEAAAQEAGGWTWLLVPEIPSAEESGPACGQWFVFWDATAWYFAPVGTDGLNHTVQAALPELAGALPGPQPGCAP